MIQSESLETKLERISAMIQEAEARLGAHSVKPVLMQQLFELEEERDRLLKELEAVEEERGQRPS